MALPRVAAAAPPLADERPRDYAERRIEALEEGALLRAIPIQLIAFYESSRSRRRDNRFATTMAAIHLERRHRKLSKRIENDRLGGVLTAACFDTDARVTQLKAMREFV